MINQFEFLPSESETTPLAQMGYGETGDDMSEFNDEPAPCDEAACDNRDVLLGNLVVTLPPGTPASAAYLILRAIWNKQQDKKARNMRRAWLRKQGIDRS